MTSFRPIEVEQVTTRPPYNYARRVFWIVDKLVHAPLTLVGSIVPTPNDFRDLHALAERHWI
jgi:hypothetical protein